jgi:hypothetical protein
MIRSRIKTYTTPNKKPIHLDASSSPSSSSPSCSSSSSPLSRHSDLPHRVVLPHDLLAFSRSIDPSSLRVMSQMAEFIVENGIQFEQLTKWVRCTLLWCYVQDIAISDIWNSEEHTAVKKAAGITSTVHYLYPASLSIQHALTPAVLPLHPTLTHLSSLSCCCRHLLHHPC